MTSQPIPTPAAQGTADASGFCTITFPNVPQGLVWTGTIQVTNSNPAANWTAYINQLTPLGQAWPGVSSSSTLQVGGMEALTIKGVGLSPGVTYSAYWVGSSDDSDSAPPTPTGSSGNTIIQPSAIFLFSTTIAPGTVYVDTILPNLPATFHNVLFLIVNLSATLLGNIEIGAFIANTPINTWTVGASAIPTSSFATAILPVPAIGPTLMSSAVQVNNNGTGPLTVTAYADQQPYQPKTVS